MHVAALGDQPKSLAFLKMRSQDSRMVNKRDCNSSTPLHWACYSGAENSILYLLAWGADVNAQD